MATLKGKGAFTDVPLIVREYSDPRRTSREPDGTIRGRFLDVQVDQSLLNPDTVRATGMNNAGVPADRAPHLVSETRTGKDGKPHVSHTEYYAESQYQAIVQAAGSNAADLSDGSGRIYGITASVFKNARGHVVVNTHKPMATTRNPRFGADTLLKQNEVTQAARDHMQAVRAQDAQDQAACQAPEQETPMDAFNTPAPDDEWADLDHA